MRLIKLWDNADREILIDMDFKPQTVLKRSAVFHKLIFECMLVMVILTFIIVSFS